MRSKSITDRSATSPEFRVGTNLVLLCYSPSARAHELDKNLYRSYAYPFQTRARARTPFAREYAGKKKIKNWNRLIYDVYPCSTREEIKFGYGDDADFGDRNARE